MEIIDNVSAFAVQAWYSFKRQTLDFEMQLLSLRTLNLMVVWFIQRKSSVFVQLFLSPRNIFGRLFSAQVWQPEPLLLSGLFSQIPLSGCIQSAILPVAQPAARRCWFGGPLPQRAAEVDVALEQNKQLSGWWLMERAGTCTCTQTCRSGRQDHYWSCHVIADSTAGQTRQGWITWASASSDFNVVVFAAQCTATSAAVVSLVVLFLFSFQAFFFSFWHRADIKGVGSRASCTSVTVYEHTCLSDMS